jgi:formylglycine-generating enzyme required for sulfatase activity
LRPTGKPEGRGPRIRSMLFALKFKAALVAVGLAGPLALSGVFHDQLPSGRPGAPELVTLATGTFQHRVAGDFSRDGKATDAPILTIDIRHPLAIMRSQVTSAEYARCVEDRVCPKLSQAAPLPNRPVVGVSWRDAEIYAAWLSHRTGERYRLPTDEEWAYAAGTRFNDDAILVSDSTDPSVRWLAHYELASRREKPVDKAPQPVGAFGANEHGLLDVAGNVWEWTATCFVRSSLENGRARPTNVNCGVRVVEGAHRAYMTDFVRDPRSGGCAVGAPPANLGFRLVRDPVV